MQPRPLRFAMHALFALAVSMGIDAGRAGAEEPAASYPTRPINLITLTAPGAALDVLARTIAQGLQERVHQPVVVINRTGAGGNIGEAEIARAAPDGYTIGMAIVSTHGINSTLYENLPYDPIRDITPITLAADLNCVLAIRADFPARDFVEFVAYSKANPGKLSFGSAGVGSALHMTGEMVKRAAGLDMVHVPYLGVAKSLPDLLGGQLQAIMANPADIGNLIREGRLRGLGVAAVKRDATLPDIPTFTEMGFSDIVSSTWFGIAGPAGLPPAIVQRLNSEIHAVLTTPAVAARLGQLGMNIKLTTPAEFGEYMKSEIARWAPIVKATGIKIK